MFTISMVKCISFSGDTTWKQSRMIQQQQQQQQVYFKLNIAYKACARNYNNLPPASITTYFYNVQHEVRHPVVRKKYCLHLSQVLEFK